MTQNQEKYTIFVRNIPYSTDGRQLAEAFTSFGEITQSRIISTTFRGQPTSRGFGFVDFKTNEAYQNALHHQEPIKINGENGERTLIVSEARPPRPRDTIFLGNLAEQTTEKDIRDAFKDYNISQVRLPQPRNSQQARKYFAFVKFASVEEYEKAIKLGTINILNKEIRILSARRQNRFPLRGGRRFRGRGRGRGRRSFRGRRGFRGRGRSSQPNNNNNNTQNPSPANASQGN